ncbi:D-amino acid dehydrogenase [Corynebacterium crudilactis]|uniref:Amino acid dehydrogenase n=1 Tax=Corynebacterium crudilactis TaxID=1652495 RepID=A0A172QWP8_9CORY|nr:D-amino acid dehydrogenase [Corynebacterium crudilactis]ANE05133.1 amino acid dehydrogenase [Corynebacterium crudilactis]
MSSSGKVIVVGAGMVGLSTAWHLQERGFEVTVLDRDGVAAGSSWGNAGWLAPAKTIPLSESGLWMYGPKELFNPVSPMHMPLRVDPKLWLFLVQFMAQAFQSKWDSTMADLTAIDKVALAAFDELALGGVEELTHEGPFVIGFEEESQSAGFLKEIAGVVRHGQKAEMTRLDNPQELAPMLSEEIQVAYRLEGQRFIEPGPYVQSLADSVVKRGGTIHAGAEVVHVAKGDSRPAVILADGSREEADKVVIATGAWLPGLVREYGVKTLVQAGRGYSFSVATDIPAQHSVYLPHHRMACTPYQGRFRIAGTMEFRGPDEPFQPRRVEAIVSQAKRLMRGVDFDERQDEWVGSRPVTPDGRPLIGQTKAENIYVAGGHGMWGIVLGPATGKYLAELMATGKTNSIIKPFNPLR